MIRARIVAEGTEGWSKWMLQLMFAIDHEHLSGQSGGQNSQSPAPPTAASRAPMQFDLTQRMSSSLCRHPDSRGLRAGRVQHCAQDHLRLWPPHHQRRAAGRWARAHAYRQRAQALPLALQRCTLTPAGRTLQDASAWQQQHKHEVEEQRRLAAAEDTASVHACLATGAGH